MGYPSQTHTITTEDCYILEMHRIPHGKGMEKATKPPILLVHGLLGSSADWVMGIPEKYLGKGPSINDVENLEGGERSKVGQNCNG